MNSPVEKSAGLFRIRIVRNHAVVAVIGDDA
jgi:hypothetical protein